MYERHQHYARAILAMRQLPVFTARRYCLYHAGSVGIPGCQFLSALLEAKVTELWVMQVGGKMPYRLFQNTFSASLVPGAPIVLDIGRTHLNPHADGCVPIHRTLADGRVRTNDGRSVSCQTHSMFSYGDAGTMEYQLLVSLSCSNDQSSSASIDLVCRRVCVACSHTPQLVARRPTSCTTSGG